MRLGIGLLVTNLKRVQTPRTSYTIWFTAGAMRATPREPLCMRIIYPCDAMRAEGDKCTHHTMPFLHIMQPDK